ncbi:hypothetical protein REPUB_Repub16aG0028100 [Reevesia pubescens]
MGCVVTTAHLGGSQVLGVTPRDLAKRNIVGKIVGDEIIVSCIHERMNIMIENADAFIAISGGFGTLKKIFQIASWS